MKITLILLCIIYSRNKLYKRISVIQDKIEKLQNIMPEDLGVNKILSMNLKLRKDTVKKPRPKLKNPFLPYQNTIDILPKIRGTESLICKLEFIYRLFTDTLTNELYEFWCDDKYFSYDKMFVDADSLKAILIYVIIKAQCAKLLVDVI